MASARRGNDFELEAHVPYLMNRVGLKVADAFESHLRAEGLSVEGWRVLAVLRGATASRISDLGEPTSLEPSTLSRLVKALERDDYVRRARSPDDERAITVSLTARGKRVVEKMIPIAQTMETALLADLSSAEIRTFKVLLARLEQPLPPEV